LLRLVTGFSGVDDPPLRLAFDFESGTVRRNSLAKGSCCRICLPVSRSLDTLNRGAGDGTDDDFQPDGGKN
jgi:hypothetical protein